MFRELTARELLEVAGGQGGSQAICNGAAVAAGYAAGRATGNPALGAIVTVTIGEACYTALNGGAPGGDVGGYGNGSADGNGGGGQVGGDGA